MDSKVFIDENGSCRFDFTNSIWATDQVHSLYGQYNLSLLSDVDFVVETEESILFIEYKNASIPGASKPDAFRPSEDKRIRNIAYKFYDTLIYIWSLQKHKTNRLVYILEYPCGDTVTRKEIRNRIQAYLPFILQQEGTVLQQIIDSVSVLSIDEWNDQFSEFTATLLERF